MIYLILENRMNFLNVIEETRITEIRPEDVNLRSMLYATGKCHQLISHPEKIEKRAEKPLKIILL